MATALLRLLPSIPYTPAKHNHWGPVTSTLNWCEEDYYLTEYVAEFVNTFSNLIFMYVAIKGIRNCIKEGHDRIFALSFFGLLCVGIGSFLFHATLWYSMQLVDELSMVYTTLLMFWSTFAHGRSKRIVFLHGIFCLFIGATITTVYIYLGDPEFHQNAYAVLTILVLLRSFYVMESELRPIDSAVVNRMWKLVGWGMTVFLTGFGLWNVDNAFCGELRGWRRSVGLPWGMVAEGHGWWHLLTSIGAYYELMYGVYLRHCISGRQDEFKLVWPGLWSLPVVRRWRVGEREREEKMAVGVGKKKV